MNVGLSSLWYRGLALGAWALCVSGAAGQTAVNDEPPPLIPVPENVSKLSPLGTAPDWDKLAQWDRVMTRAELEAALKDVYLDGRLLPNLWTIDDDGVSIKTGLIERPYLRVTFRHANDTPAVVGTTWRAPGDLPPLAGRAPLSDLHFAIDPGHIGGAYGVMEERRLSFAPGEAIQEGDLSLLTAQVLAERLKELGAYVSLVRETPEPVTKQRPEDFKAEALALLKENGVPMPLERYDGIVSEQRMLTVQWQCEKMFYRISEIHARAKRVNEEIKPDVVLCLHFNAESWGDAAAPQYSPENHAHILVGGCYSGTELSQQDVRFEMFSRLFARVQAEEIPLGEVMTTSLLNVTGLPPYLYQTPNARPAGKVKGLFARNLLANRLYQCPVIYLEPYVMNNEDTYRRLLLGQFVGRTRVGDRLRTSIINDYVRAVSEGLLNYYQPRRTH